jgi:hypothetical protein
MARSLTNKPFIVEIVVRGHLNPQRTGWFEGYTLTSRADGTTHIFGPVADQSALYALISRIRDLGLTLISVNSTES